MIAAKIKSLNSGLLYVVRALESVFPCVCLMMDLQNFMAKLRPYIQDVRTGDLGIRRVALEYHTEGWLCSTLRNRFTGRVFPVLVLLNIHVKRKKSLLNAKSVCEIRAVVRAIVSNKLSLDNLIIVSQEWWDCFHQCHPH